MRSSCINHPPKEPLVLIRQWQLDATGDQCAAALLNFFEYWHNIKLEQAEQTQRANTIAANHGANDDVEEPSLLQWHTEKDLREGLLKTWSKNVINRAIDLLVEKSFISIHPNPSKRYHFDRTRHFLFHPEIVNEWLDKPQ